MPNGEHLSSQDAFVLATTIKSACQNLIGQTLSPARNRVLASHQDQSAAQSAAEWAKSNFFMTFLKEGVIEHIVHFSGLPEGPMASEPTASQNLKSGGGW